MPPGAVGALLLASSLAWRGAALTSGRRQESQSHGERAAAAAESAAEHGQSFPRFPRVLPPILPVPIMGPPLIPAPILPPPAPPLKKVADELLKASVFGEVTAATWMGEAVKGLSALHKINKMRKAAETKKSSISDPEEEEEIETGEAGTRPEAQDDPEEGQEVASDGPPEGPSAPQKRSLEEAQQVLQEVRAKLRKDIEDINTIVLQGATTRSEIARIRQMRVRTSESCFVEVKKLNATQRQLLVIKTETKRTIAAMEKQMQLAKAQIMTSRSKLTEVQQKNGFPSTKAAGGGAGKKPSEVSVLDNQAAEEAEAQRAKAEGVSLRELILTLQAENKKLETDNDKLQEEHADREWEFNITGRQLEQENEAVQSAQKTTARLKAQIAQLEQLLAHMYKPGKNAMPVAQVEAEVTKLRHEKNKLMAQRTAAQEARERQRTRRMMSYY